MESRRPNLLRVGATLALDSLTGELVSALGDASIATIVLKGPALEQRLYGAGESRTHDDIDLLAAHSDLKRAEDLLHGLGFRYAAESEHARAWIRERDGITVDLHKTLIGIGVSPAEAWSVLSAETEPMRVGRASLNVLNPSATALHVALHAAQHGALGSRPAEDLKRAVERLPEQVWTRAAELAVQLAALPAFAAGLRLDPHGAELASALGLSGGGSVETALRIASPPVTALGIQRLATTPGMRGKAAFLMQELVPPATFMRAVFPFARRGRLGLAATYLWRPWWLAWHAGPALRAWRRARRQAGT